MSAAAPSRARDLALWLLLPLMLAGSAIGVYMARHHEVELYGGEAYAGEELVGCVETEGVSCDVVNTSPWSEVLGVPTFAWAIPTYLLVAVLALLALRGRRGALPLAFAVGLGCVGFSGFLYWISVTRLGVVCLWCMRLYAINAAIPVLVAVAGGWARPGTRELGLAASVYLGLTGATVGVQKAFRAHLLDGAPAMAALAEATERADTLSDRDPEGPAPELRIPVTTEDRNQAEVVIRPEDPWKGNPDAKVAIVEFADFECGYCKRAGFQLRRLYEAYKDEIVFVYKHFPMDPACNPGVNNKRHPQACNAHAAAACAQEQGQFWAYHDLLYKNNHQLRTEHLEAYAEALGLDLPAWRSCLQSGRGAAKVQQAAQDGAAVDSHGTPRIWIAGQLYRSGSSAEQMARALELALGRSGADAARNAAKVREDDDEVRPVPVDGPGMQRIAHGDHVFLIDTFEASLADGAAQEGKHRIPATRMSWFAAHDACEAAGKRLCTEAEWVTACQGAVAVDDDHDGQTADDLIEGNAYPYGDFHAPGRCWEDHRDPPGLPEGQATPWRPVYTGELPGCVTPDGVYDLTGNVEEWVGTTEGEAVLLGGAFDTPDDKARCYRRNDTFGAGFANLRTGFRCCKDP
ncbi:MAG: thioredoxin domain-containing protein [Alphaproteobacteria bacterium]|nr:thioredoxin domain-containing protein [Alphaproteobacteria bacterium]